MGRKESEQVWFHTRWTEGNSRTIREQTQSYLQPGRKRERESAKIYVTIANEIRPKSIQMKKGYIMEPW